MESSHSSARLKVYIYCSLKIAQSTAINVEDVAAKVRTPKWKCPLGSKWSQFLKGAAQTEDGLKMDGIFSLTTNSSQKTQITKSVLDSSSFRTNRATVSPYKAGFTLIYREIWILINNTAMVRIHQELLQLFHKYKGISKKQRRLIG